MNDLDVLSQIPFFHNLDPGQLGLVAGIARSMPLKRGRVLFSEGDKAEGFYAVMSGTIKIYKLSPEGKEQILHIFGTGEPFGEVPVFAGGAYPASAEALEDSRVMFFPRAEFVSLIRREPDLALAMLAVLSMRLRQFTHLVENLSLKEVPGRLAAFLLQSDSEAGNGDDAVELNIAKGQLAGLLGTIPETLSRILGRMSQQGIIDVQGRRILILDRTALEKLARGEKLGG